MRKFLPFFEGLGAALTAIEKAGYLKANLKRGFDVDKEALEGDIYKLSEDVREAFGNGEEEDYNLWEK